MKGLISTIDKLPSCGPVVFRYDHLYKEKIFNLCYCFGRLLHIHHKIIEHGIGHDIDNASSAGIYLLKDNYGSPRTKCEICSKLTVKTPKRRHWRRSGVFIVNFKHISHLALMFLLLSLNMQLPAGRGVCVIHPDFYSRFTGDLVISVDNKVNSILICIYYKVFP